MIPDLIQYQDRGLKFTRKPKSIDELRSAAQALDYFERNHQWCWGDLLNTAEAHFPEAFSDLVEVFPGARNTRNTFMRICGKFPPVRRKWDLDFGYYEAVAARSNTEQEILLDLVVENGWSVHKLRTEIKGSNGRVPKVIVCPNCGFQIEK